MLQPYARDHRSIQFFKVSQRIQAQVVLEDALPPAQGVAPRELEERDNATFTDV